MSNLLNIIHVVLMSYCFVFPLGGGGPTIKASSVPQEYGRIVLNKKYSLKDQLKKENTIYIVQNGFDLKGSTITVPDNCELRFDGGYLSNGKVFFNNTLLSGSKIQMICDCTGTVSNEYVDPVWFGADPNGKDDSTKPMQMAIDIASNSRCMDFKMPSGVFLISKPLVVYRNKNIEFHGNHNSKIKANSPMDYMITSSDRSRRQYISSRFHTFILDGNRKSSIFNEKKWEFNNSTSLAKGGISFPCGFIYTQIYDILFTNIDGWAIKAIDTYSMDYHNLSYYYCENGICLYNANGVSITNCEFTTIRGFGALIGWGHQVSFRENVMEKIGKSAIVLGGGCGPVTINSNYFEACSINGLSITLADKNILKDIHCDIGVIGVDASEYENEKEYYPVGKNSLSQVLITGNDFQEAAKNNNCLILGCAVESSDISNNRAYEDVVVLGTIQDSKSSIVRDIRICDNINYKNKNKLPSFNSLYKKRGTNNTLIGIREQ